MSEPTAFPLDESKLPFKIPKDTKPREKIMKLGQMITDRVPAKLRRLTVEDPEYWGLASIVTDEMADVALKMKVRQPMTLPELEKATGKPAKELEPLLYQMSCVGLLEYNWENPRREKQYILPMFVPGSAEFFNMNKQQIADHPEVTAFFERMTFLPLEHITAMVPPGGAGIGMHVIPVEKAIETENHSLDIEHISHWLKKYQGKYAAGPCSCRMSRAAMGEGCGDDPDDWCIGVGDMADYLVETNKGHYVTYDEVMRILQKAEDNGFVHQITNIDGENKIFAICNCNVNVCNALRTSQLFNTPNMSRSAYVAKVEPQNCVACGRCVEFCPAGAVKLGQKLCTKDGSVEYPRQELPDVAVLKIHPLERVDDLAVLHQHQIGVAAHQLSAEGVPDEVAHLVGALELEVYDAVARFHSDIQQLAAGQVLPHQHTEGGRRLRVLEALFGQADPRGTAPGRQQQAVGLGAGAESQHQLVAGRFK